RSHEASCFVSCAGSTLFCSTEQPRLDVIQQAGTAERRLALVVRHGTSAFGRLVVPNGDPPPATGFPSIDAPRTAAVQSTQILHPGAELRQSTRNRVGSCGRCSASGALLTGREITDADRCIRSAGGS